MHGGARQLAERLRASSGRRGRFLRASGQRASASPSTDSSSVPQQTSSVPSATIPHVASPPAATALNERFGTSSTAGLAKSLGSTQHTGVPSLDRKSTRLNSSHVKISYAVFCLK